ncbi:hypothetical protein BOS5A_231275 [Bosea sp. EC-HK365B]|nr:conserved hypothetical protein [Bosea sp. 7B]CAD5300306.1 conserved hypothetical protein [Bosea sp. 21B]VVT62007.1 hypothetical protein BOS5A_231275 [Bosea sp. EC-HK365B]VXC97843.1 conserved hypothetical protein [Bosea sp. 127]
MLELFNVVACAAQLCRLRLQFALRGRQLIGQYGTLRTLAIERLAMLSRRCHQFLPRSRGFLRLGRRLVLLLPQGLFVPAGVALQLRFQGSDGASGLGELPRHGGDVRGLAGRQGDWHALPQLTGLRSIRVARDKEKQDRGRDPACQGDEPAPQRRLAGRTGFRRHALPDIGGLATVLPSGRRTRQRPVSGIDCQARVVPGDDGLPISRCAFDRVAHVADASWSAHGPGVPGTSNFVPADANPGVYAKTPARVSTTPSPRSN